MEIAGWTLVGLMTASIAVCGGTIAAKHGRNPIVYGMLSVISPVNLVLLGYLAFSDIERRES